MATTKFTVNVMEDVIEGRQRYYRRRPDLGFMITDVPAPSKGLRKAREILKERMPPEFILFSAGLTGRHSALLKVRRGLPPVAQPPDGTVKRPPGVRQPEGTRAQKYK